MAISGLHFILDKTYSMKNLLTYALILPAILLASCSKPATVPIQHLTCEGVALGQHIDSFAPAFCQMLERQGLEVETNVCPEVAYFKTNEDRSPLFSNFYSADLLNDTVLNLFFYYYDVSDGYLDSISQVARNDAHTVMNWEDGEDRSCAFTTYLPGGEKYMILMYSDHRLGVVYTDSAAILLGHTDPSYF